MSHIVIDETLFREFFKFYLRRKDVDRSLVGNLFCKIQPFLITTSQLASCDITDVLQQYMINSGPWISYVPSNSNLKPFDPILLKEMVAASKLKVMLTHNAVSNAPYKTVCINDQTKEQFSFAATYKSRESRAEAVTHLQVLMQGAKTNIHIHDKYLNIPDAKKIANMLSKIDAAVQVHFFVGGGMSQSQKPIKHALSNLPPFVSVTGKKRMKVKPYAGGSKHDRYIQIDNTLEIILSGGFDHLFSDQKDFTYVVRVIR